MTAEVREARGEELGERRVPRRTTLGRLTITSAVLTVLVGADAIYMEVAGYHASDSNNFQLSDAATVFFAAGLLFICTIALFALWRQACRAAR